MTLVTSRSRKLFRKRTHGPNRFHCAVQRFPAEIYKKK
uniref:Uncharacterized protein n=1 Tax=Anopheles quadriannulatus TaxID=34691 RepID=A0A182XRW3_ANOQN